MTTARRTLEELPTLVVEDNPFMLGVLAHLLHEIGIENIALAADGREAMERCREMKPELVLTDWRMPGVSGLEFVQWLRRAPDSPNREAIVILITASNLQSEIIEARDAGVSAFLTKPVTLNAVRDRIKATLAEQRAFVRTPHYVGPCRRRHASRDYSGPLRRLDEPAKDGPGRDSAAAARLHTQIEELEALVPTLEPTDRDGVKQLRTLARAMRATATAAGDHEVAQVTEILKNYVQAVGLSGRLDHDVLRTHAATIKQILAIAPSDARRADPVSDLKAVVANRLAADRRAAS